MKRRSFLSAIGAALAAMPFVSLLTKRTSILPDKEFRYIGFAESYIRICDHDFCNPLDVCSKCGRTKESVYLASGKKHDVSEPSNLRMICRWNPDAKLFGIVLGLSELHVGDNFIMYDAKAGRMPTAPPNWQNHNTFYVAKSEPYIADGRWTIDAVLECRATIVPLPICLI